VIDLRGEPLARLGYWRVGGSLGRYVVPDTPAELRAARPDRIIGAGSNLLVPDAGLPGTTARLGAAFRTVEVVGERGTDVLVRAGAGLPDAVLLARLERLGLAGLACLAGVPGTVGGAVAMNAGTALGELASVLVEVEGADGSRLARAELPMRYREGGLPPGFVVTAATFALRRDDGGERAAIQAHLARRRATQPLDLPSCGSVFRNPPGDHAGRLVESVGLKGHRLGGAAISDRHANFIVNLGAATASDVMGLIRLAWAQVRERTGVVLVPEVHVLGEWPPGVWPLG
jgi:UDP-N-acetylmuramate dehydrogenase